MGTRQTKGQIEKTQEIHRAYKNVKAWEKFVQTKSSSALKKLDALIVKLQKRAKDSALAKRLVTKLRTQRKLAASRVEKALKMSTRITSKYKP